MPKLRYRNDCALGDINCGAGSPPEDEWRERSCTSAAAPAKRHSDSTTREPSEPPHSSCRPCSVVLTRCDSLAVALEMRFKNTPVNNGDGAEQSSRPTIESLIEVQRQEQQRLLQQQHGSSKVLPDAAAPRELVRTSDFVAGVAAPGTTKTVVDEKRQLTTAPVAQQRLLPPPATHEYLRELSINDVVGGGSRAHERSRCKAASAASHTPPSPPCTTLRKRPHPSDEAPTIASALQLSNSSTTAPKQSRRSVPEETSSSDSSPPPPPPQPKLAACSERHRSGNRAAPTSDRATIRQKPRIGTSRSAAAAAVAADDLCDTVNRQRGLLLLEANHHHVPDSPAAASAAPVVIDQQFTQAPSVTASTSSRQPAGTATEQCCFANATGLTPDNQPSSNSLVASAAEPDDRFKDTERVTAVGAGHSAPLRVTAATHLPPTCRAAAAVVAPADTHCSDDDNDDDDDEPRLVIDEEAERSEPSSLPGESGSALPQMGGDGDGSATAAAADDEQSSSVCVGSHYEKETTAADKMLDCASPPTDEQQHQPVQDLVAARSHDGSQHRRQQEHQHLAQQQAQRLSERESVSIQNHDTSQHHQKEEQQREQEERQKLSRVELALVRDHDNSQHYRQHEEQQQQQSVIEPLPVQNQYINQQEDLLQEVQRQQQQCVVSKKKLLEHVRSTALDSDSRCASSKAAGNRSPTVALPPPELVLANSAPGPKCSAATSAVSSDTAGGSAAGNSAERRYSSESGRHRSLASAARSSGSSGHVAAEAAAAVPGRRRSLSSAACSSGSFGHVAVAAAAVPLRDGSPHDDLRHNNQQQQQMPRPPSCASYSHGRILPPEDIVLMARTFIMVSHRKPPPFDAISGALVVEQVEQEKPAGSYRFMVKCRAGCEETLSPLGFMEHVEGPAEHLASALGSAALLSYPIEFQDNLLSPVKVRMWNLFCDFFAKHVHPNEDLYIPEPQPTAEPPSRPCRRPSAALPAPTTSSLAASVAANSALRCAADRSTSKASASKTTASKASTASPATTDDYGRPAEVPESAVGPGEPQASPAASEPTVVDGSTAAAAAASKPAQAVLSSSQPQQQQPTHRRSGIGGLAAVVDRLLQLHVGAGSSLSCSAATAAGVAESDVSSRAVGQQQAVDNSSARRSGGGSSRRRSRFPAMRSSCDSGDCDSGSEECSPPATAESDGPLLPPVSQQEATAATPSALGTGDSMTAAVLPRPQLQRAAAAACRSAGSNEELQKWHQALRSLEHKPCSHRPTKSVPSKRPQQQPFEIGRRSPAQGIAAVQQLPTHPDVRGTVPVVGSRDNAAAHRTSPSSETSHGSGSRRIDLNSPEGGCSAGSTSPGQPQSAVVSTFRINPRPHTIPDDRSRLTESTAEATTGAALTNESTEGGGHHASQSPFGVRATPPPEYRPRRAAEDAQEQGASAAAESRVATVPTIPTNRRRRAAATRGNRAAAGIASLPPPPTASSAAATSSEAAEQLFRMAAAAAAAVELPRAAVGQESGSIDSSLEYVNPRGDDVLARQQGDLLAQNAFLPRDVVAELLRDMWHLYKQSRTSAAPPRTTAAAIAELASCSSRFSAPHATVHPVQSVAVQPEPRQQVIATAPATHFGFEPQAPAATTSTYHQQTRLGQQPFSPVGGTSGASLWYLSGDQRTTAAAATAPHVLASQTGHVLPAGAEAVFMQQNNHHHRQGAGAAAVAAAAHLASLQQLHHAYQGRPSPPLPPPPSGMPLHGSHFHHSACQPSPFSYQHTHRPQAPHAVVSPPGYGQQLPDGSLTMNSSRHQQQQQQSSLQQQQSLQQQSTLQQQQQSSLQQQQQSSLQQQPQHDSLPYGMTHQMNIGPLSLGLGLQVFHPPLPSGVHLPNRLLPGQSGLDLQASLRQPTFIGSDSVLAGDPPARYDAGVSVVHAAQPLPPVQPQKQLLPPSPLSQQLHILQQFTLYQQQSRRHGNGASAEP